MWNGRKVPFLKELAWEGAFFTDGGEAEDWALCRQEGRSAAAFLYRARDKFGANVVIHNWWKE